MMTSISSDDARPHVVEMLDAIRKQEQACALSKSRYMILARRYGLPVSDIAELLGMSEQGVRKAIKRIEQSTPDGVI